MVSDCVAAGRSYKHVRSLLGLRAAYHCDYHNLTHCAYIYTLTITLPPRASALAVHSSVMPRTPIARLQPSVGYYDDALM